MIVKQIIDDSPAVLDEFVDNGKKIINDSQDIIDDSKAIIDDSQAIIDKWQISNNLGLKCG